MNIEKGIRTKIFYLASYEILENKVNEFIENKEIVDIKYCLDFAKNSKTYFSVMIIFKVGE